VAEGESRAEEEGALTDLQDEGVPDLVSLDALIEKAMEPFERNGARPTSRVYRRALRHFRDFVASGRAMSARSWSDAADLFLAAVRDRSWSAPESFYMTARASLGHLLRADERDG
jgi:hypothetical protein